MRNLCVNLAYRHCVLAMKQAGLWNAKGTEVTAPLPPPSGRLPQDRSCEAAEFVEI